MGGITYYILFSNLDTEINLFATKTQIAYNTYMKILIKWLITSLSLLASAYLIPGIVVNSIYIALIVAVVLGILNLFLKPILIVLTLPINILTLGLFTLVINGLIFWFVATFVDGFSVSGFISALFGALVVSFFSWLGNKLLN